MSADKIKSFLFPSVVHVRPPSNQQLTICSLATQTYSDTPTTTTPTPPSPSHPTGPVPVSPATTIHPMQRRRREYAACKIVMVPPPITRKEKHRTRNTPAASPLLSSPRPKKKRSLPSTQQKQTEPIVKHLHNALPSPPHAPPPAYQHGSNDGSQPKHGQRRM